jgi:hypothetical protein
VISEDRLQYAELVEFLAGGPTGDLRRWASTLVVRTLETKGNLRSLVAWWLAALEPTKVEQSVEKLLVGSQAGVEDDGARARLLGLLDWMAAEPNRPRARDALEQALTVTRGDVRPHAIGAARLYNYAAAPTRVFPRIPALSCDRQQRLPPTRRG